MQSQPMGNMAGMNANLRGPVDGTPIMGNMQRPVQPQNNPDPRDRLNTYIYDYFLRNNHTQLAHVMIECNLPMSLKPSPAKPSPSGRNVNGVDMDKDPRDALPEPNLPEGQLADNSFLLDWWAQFWDIFMAARKQQPNEKGTQYITHIRNLTQMHSDTRNTRMTMANNVIGAAQYQNMIRGMPNGVGVAPNDLKRTAAINNRGNPNGNPMVNMQLKNQMLSAQMQRDGSGMDMNGQRPQSPGSSENASSPNKRPRVEGQMNAGNLPGNQFNNEYAPQAQNVQQKSIEGMNSGVQGSPMHQQGLDGQSDMFAGNPSRTGMPAAPGQPQGNHALQDYQMQLMLLEQQNKKRLLMARQEQDNQTGGPHAQAAVGAPGFPPSMSPGNIRPGPSPNPSDQMKRTPKLNQQGLPGSPMPDVSMQQPRGSPAPSMGFDPSQNPPGMPPQFYNPQMQQQNPMGMQPPRTHPAFNAQQLTPQQMDQMRNSGGMQNGGAWRGQPGMMQQGQQFGPMANNPQQRNHMPPPPAPAGEQPRAQEPSPSQPTQAPPTPNQGNKAQPKKKNTGKNDKKATKAKGAGATPAASASDEPPTPTPSTPVTAQHPKGFPNGQQHATQPPSQPQPSAPQQQAPMDPGPPFGNNLEDSSFGLSLGFGDDNGLESFDFDSFLDVGGDEGGGFSTLSGDFGFGEPELEA